MSEDLEFVVRSMLVGSPLGNIDPSSYNFNNPIYGAGSCELKLAIPTVNPQSLRDRTIPDAVELYIKQDRNYVWSGWIDYRNHKPNSPDLTLKASHWKAWYYSRLIGPDKFFMVDDEYNIVRALLAYADSGPGTPTVTPPVGLSGVVREFTGQPFWSFGQCFDNLMARDGSFEWEVSVRDSATTGNIELFFEVFRQGNRRASDFLVYLDINQSVNEVNIGDLVEDATERATRVWATGEGTAGTDQKYAFFTNPEAVSETILMKEVVSNWSGVTQLDTLFDHALREYYERQEPLSQVSVDVPMERVDLWRYRPGDRARVVFTDNWQSFDIPGVRIIDRAIKGGRGALPIATLVLDFLDRRTF